jgi:hypothetical protein
MTIEDARAKAHQKYDDCMFCPGCSKLLTGLHMGSRCYTNWIERRHNRSSKIRRKDMAGGSEEPIIIGLAIAVITGIGIVCLMDALKNKLK